MALRTLISLVLVLVWAKAAFAEVNSSLQSSSFILSVYNTTEAIYTERIRQSLRAVGKNGKLVILADDQTLSAIRKLLLEEFEGESNSVLLASTSEKWIRDGATAWEPLRDGSFRPVGPDYMASGQSKSPPMNVLRALAECSAGNISIGKHNAAHHGPIRAGGNFVSDGTGTCVSDFSSVESRKFAKNLGCTVAIAKPQMDAQLSFPHPNHHVDLAVSFLAPNVAMVSDVDMECSGELAAKVRGYFDKYAQALTHAKVDVFRSPVAGCPEETTAHAGGITRKVVSLRSYANLLQIRGAYLVPSYLGETKDSEYQKDNDRNKKYIQELINSGTIPDKPIFPIPITEMEAMLGGSFRCMTWEVPDNLSGCDQATLDKKMNAKIEQVTELEKCVRTAPNKETCKLARDIFKVLESQYFDPFAAQDYTFAGKKVLMDSKGRRIEANENLREKFRDAFIRLATNIKKFCNLH